MVVVAPAVPHKPGSWHVIYFDAPNRGEQVRLLFVLAKTPFEDVRVSPYPQGLDPYKKAAMGDESPLLGTDECPAVTAPDGTHCIETSEIMRFVGVRVGLAPEAGSSADAKAMQQCLLAQSLMNQVFYPLLKPMVVQHILRTELAGSLRCLTGSLGGKHGPEPAALLAETLPTLEAAIDGPYLLGANMCYADVSVFAVLRECLDYECFDETVLLMPYPKLAALMADLEAKAASWVDQRVARHQFGLRRTTEFFAASFTPFPWSRRKK